MNVEGSQRDRDMDDRLPVIVGIGEVTQRPETEGPREPLALMAEAARLAARDAGSEDLVQSIDSLRVINVLSWPSKAPAQDLARALAVAPREQIYTAVGGNTPQWQVNEVAEAIATGDIKLALIAGAEAMYSARRARARGVDLGWSHRGNPGADAGDTRYGTNDAEAKHGASIPTSVYPLFENALRAHYGRTIEDHQRIIGEMMSRFSVVAAANEHAWFRNARTGAEIATAGPDNRYIGFPYPKYMNAIMDVDQGAALLLTSAGEARRLGIPDDRCVYIWGCGEATDHWFITERVNLYSSPAMRANTRSAMEMAGVGVDEITHFDLYSCFPSAVQFARDALGLAHDDPRPLTVAGGLPYFGGPGNNYVTHSIAAMVRTLREDRRGIGMVTANGWYATKHATGIYATSPPRRAWVRADPDVAQAGIDAQPRPSLQERPSGSATVETYTVIFDRDGAPSDGIVIGRMPDSARFIANTPDDRRLLESMTKQEMVGAPGVVEQGEDGRNVFTPA
jgi:acetyl-CoA C-acetyltransferase